MQKNHDLQSKLASILEVARLAPSVHNAQPWRVEYIPPDSLLISLDSSHTPHESDPTGRQAMISLGILVEAIAIASLSEGWEVHEVTLDVRKTKLRLVPTKGMKPDDLAPFLGQRCSDRSIYKPVSITPDMIGRLEKARIHPAVSIRVITSPKLMNEVADLTSKGISLALSSPAFRKELSSYLILPWSTRRRGIAVRSLYIPWLLEVTEPLLMRIGLGLRSEAALEKRRWLSASAVIAILADGDMPKYWLEVGRSYLRVSLVAEALDLSQATSAAIVEASNYHDDIEERLGTNQRILAMLRVGKGSPHKHFSPRVSVEELLTSN